MCAIEEKVLLLWNRSFYSVFNPYLGTWYLGNDWLAWFSSKISLSGVLICGGWRRKMLFRYNLYLNHSYCCRSLDLAIDKTSQWKIRTNSDGSTKIQKLSNIDVAQIFLTEEAARLPATCNQMSAPCKQLRSKKVHNVLGPFDEM